MADVLEEAQRLYAESLSAMADQRKQIEADLAFSDPSNPDQWESDVKTTREGDPGGKRPCLVFDQSGQYVANVAGQIEKQPPSIHAIPVGGGAQKEAAEQIDGRFRHVEYASKAGQHYTRALTSAARTGVGYLVVRPVVLDPTLNLQEPRIGSEPDPLKVVFDPWSTETDGSDAESGFILSALNPAYFKRRWPRAKVVDFGDTNSRRRESERKVVLVAEQWEKTETSVEMVAYLDENGELQSAESEDFAHQVAMSGVHVQPLKTYQQKQPLVKWRQMSGDDVLEESEYPSEWIGIVPVYGYVAFIDGRMRYCGIPRRARAPQQAYNYHKSEELAYIATAPKAPWVISKRAAKGVEPLWDRAAVDTRAALYWNDIDEDGAVSAPARTNVAINVANHQAGAESALRDIQASIGMYQANLGAPSNESSGVAIENRKQQGEASTAHFPSHMAASLGQVGQIVMQMDARLSDTRREQPIMGIDGSAGSVTVDPDQSEAFARGPEGVSINPALGKYGVRVVVGASYSTQRSQTNAAFAEIMRGNPEMAPTVAPFWAQTLDFPGSDKFAQALAAMAPEPVKAILQPEGKDAPDPAKLAQQLAQCKQALDEAIQHAKAAQDDADQAIASAADAKRLAQVRERELDIESYNAETARLKVTGANAEQTQAVVRDLINEMLSQPEPLPGDPPPGDAQPEAMEQPAEPPPPPEPPPDHMPMLIGALHGIAQSHGAMAEALGKLGGPRRIVKDEHGEPVGMEPV